MPTKIKSTNITADAVDSPEIAAGAVAASEIASTFDISSKTVTLPVASVTAHVTSYDDSDLQNDIALLGFKVASNDSSVKYNLANQFVDDFQDASGISAGDSTNEARDSTGKYFKGETGSTPTISGNWNSTAVDGAYTYYKWTTATSSGSYTTDTAQDYEYLVIGGGGAGGGAGTGGNAGGGGAGGFRTATGFAVAATTISGITVGAGGAGTTYDATPGSGGNSVFSSITSIGGGSGGDYDTVPAVGGSGGGGTSGAAAANPNGAAGTAGQGNAGGDSAQGDIQGAAGGGGAGAVGGDRSGTTAGNGGNGTANSITGASVTYAGGGGGGADASYTAGTGGTGGGGAGCNTTGCTATSGTANTGGGGGGAGEGGGSSGSIGGDGGSGIVVIRRVTTTAAEGANLTLVSTSTTAEVAPTKGDLVFSYSDGAGTATYTGGSPTIQAFISRNGAAYSSAVTLSKVGTAGGNTILAAHDVDLSGITSGTAMRYKITTTGQSGSVKTRIHAVSLGWS